MKVPDKIKIRVPEQFGSAYTNSDGSRQWVERRRQIGKELVKKFRQVDQFYADDKLSSEGCRLLANVFTDWSLCDDEGPLPKPWHNPDAFDALFDCDLDLFLWILSLNDGAVARLLHYRGVH